MTDCSGRIGLMRGKRTFRVTAYRLFHSTVKELRYAAVNHVNGQRAILQYSDATHKRNTNWLKMILSCTSPPIAIYANTKSAGSGRAKTPQGSTVGLWPDRFDRSGRLERTQANLARPGRSAEWPSGQWKITCTMSTFARAAGHGLNADRSECRPPKMAVFGRNADPNDTANYRFVKHGCQYSRSAFRPFDIPTVKQTR